MITPKEIGNLQIGDYVLIKIIGRNGTFQAIIIDYDGDYPVIKVLNDPYWDHYKLKFGEYEILEKLSKEEIKKELSVEDIARISHRAYIAYCIAIQDYSQLPWDQAPDWQTNSTKATVKYRLENPHEPVYIVHEAWKDIMIKDGWKYGLFFNEQKKEHPYLTSFQDLSQIGQMRVYLLSAIVDEMQQIFKVVADLTYENR
jgi:hypothetical protein